MINTFYITTGMGKYFGKLPFLSETELEEFNSIGYSGKTTKGLKISRENYLNSLNKGEFQVTQTKFDNGSFEEGFTIVWVH
jgi:hypothetical protein